MDAGDLKLPDTDDYTFDQWITSTGDLQIVAYGQHPHDWIGDDGRMTEEGMDFVIRKGAWAAVVELVELTNEAAWKPWASTRHARRAAIIKEAVDVLHFVGNLLCMVDCTGEELTAEYRSKQLKNLQRQIDGYDGTSDKCPHCARVLDDSGRVTIDGVDHCGGCGGRIG